MSSIRAIVVDPDAPGRFVIKEVEAPQPGPSEALVQVEAISLNRGEVMVAMTSEAGWRPGRDLAGTVIKSAANGGGPKIGSRVVGMADTAAWAEQVAVPTNRLAELPARVTFAQAATFPTAGLTALRAVEKGGCLLNKRVLITGSTGGVGLFAHQFARLGGAFVVGTARQTRHEAVVREAGADEVIVGDDLESARAYGVGDSFPLCEHPLLLYRLLFRSHTLFWFLERRMVSKEVQQLTVHKAIAATHTTQQHTGRCVVEKVNSLPG